MAVQCETGRDRAKQCETVRDMGYMCWLVTALCFARKLTVVDRSAMEGAGIAFVYRRTRTLCSFGVGAHILLVTISGPLCKILERPPHMTNQVSNTCKAS